MSGLIRLLAVVAVAAVLITVVDPATIDSLISGFIADIKSLIFDSLLGGLI